MSECRCHNADSPLDDPAAMARATEALQTSAAMPHDRRAHYIVAAALEGVTTHNQSSKRRAKTPSTPATEQARNRP